MAKNKDNKKNKNKVNPDTQDLSNRQNMPQGAFKENPRGAK